MATKYTEGNFLNFDTQVDLLTYEMENIDIDALLKLKADGYKVVTRPLSTCTHTRPHSWVSVVNLQVREALFFAQLLLQMSAKAAQINIWSKN